MALCLIDWDDKANFMMFAFSNDKESLAIVYKGIISSSFKLGGLIW